MNRTKIKGNQTAKPPVAKLKIRSRKSKKLKCDRDAETQLVEQVSASLTKTKQNEEDLLQNAWAAGNGLNQLRKKFRYSTWGNYLKEHNPNVCDTTLDRYRAVARKFPTLGDLNKSGITTLMDAYRACGLVKGKKISGNASKGTNPDDLMVKVLAQAAKHFDHPENMARPQKASLKRALVRLVEVFSKIEDAAFTWTDEEFNKIAALYQKVQTQKAGA